VLRKLNFTERAKIPRSAIRIALRRDPDGVLVFDPQFALADFGVPAHASLFVEATYRNSYMRFDCGTAGKPSPPADRRLIEIDSGNVVRFRVKIVDNSRGQHRVVAMADGITVSVLHADVSGRTPLLPVDFKDLGDQVWRIQFEPDTPVLELNNRIAGIELMAKSDARFFAFVFPAAVREILTQILLVDEYRADEESEEWWSLWLRWATHHAAEPAPSDDEDRGRWIDEAVAGFCAHFEIARRLNDAAAEKR
jgi:hypothetical protein